MNKITVFVLFLVILSSSAFAEVMISEIMYDPYGTETKKEWIELYNAGSETLNITGWKIKDGTTARTLNLYSGSFILDPDSFVILARNGENFSNEYTSYVGTVLESSFSLTNSGKELYLLNQLNEIVDNVNYTDLSDEGYSIELNGSTSDNSKIENWISGVLGGSPGSIIKIDEDIDVTINETDTNETDTNTNETTDDTNEEDESDDQNETPNSVPEFNSFGTVIILTFGIVMIFRRKN
jgi:hypothetical protein